MKKRILQFLETKPIRFWLFFHLAIPALLGFSVLLTGTVRINAMLQDMLPQSAQSKEAVKADNILSEKNAGEAIILAAAPDFENAKKGADFLFNEFEKSTKVRQLFLYFDSTGMAQLNDFLYKYRFVITGKETLSLLENGKADEIAEDAIAAAYGAFNFFSLENIDKDPFLLTQRRMEDIAPSLLLGGSLGLKDDVLSSHIDGKWYVLLRMTLSPQAVSLSGSRNIIREIYAAAEEIKKDTPDLEFYFSGVPFHSYESSSNAQREISVISTAALLIILALFLFIFRSPLPVLLSVFDALLSLIMATTAALLIFREVHIITFVFGTTLIGTCVDYSIHFFIHWKGNTALKNGNEIRSHISKSIIMCFVSTEICFFAFLLAPFPILKQFAVFSMTGLASSFLSIYCFFPCIKVPQKRKMEFFTGKLFSYFKNFSLPPAVRVLIIAIFSVGCLLIIFLHPNGIKIENDISSLYTMSSSMQESEKITSRVLGQGSSFWYFIVSGRSPEETIENEEKLIQRLKKESSAHKTDSFLGTSVFVPSVKKQEETYEAMKTLLPLVKTQYQYLGFPPEYTEIYYNEFALGAQYCLPEKAPAVTGISNFWIGEINGHYYSCVLPVIPEDEEIYRSIAGEFDFVYFINKAKDISRDLDTLTKTMIYFFLAAYFIISAVIFIFYPRRDILKICSVPFFLIFSSLAVLTLSNIPLGFFSIAGLIMVFGLGLDFIFYMTGNFNPNTGGAQFTKLAVTLSFLTTLLSFGALVFSNFTPVYIFALTVSSGLSAAFFSAMLLSNKKSSTTMR
ncbi:MAG: MMPL family transporter [Spirochaetes bacterium]|nr:MMPL family transporter [Spirochaetota bacterium]